MLGYAYAAPFKERAAYDWAVETTIYLRRDCRGMGVGRRLYQQLEELLKRQHITNANACIAYPNPGSILFHERMDTARSDISPAAAISSAAGMT